MLPQCGSDGVCAEAQPDGLTKLRDRMRSPVRVFIVEDSPLIRKRIIDNLQALGGFDVVGFAESESSAVAAIVEMKPDVVVTDIRLKEGNGIEVVRQLRRKPSRPGRESTCFRITPTPNIAASANWSAPTISSTSPASTIASSRPCSRSRRPCGATRGVDAGRAIAATLL
ncbi:MAG: response regulator [Betaproteobacteria bacterium]|nr:MAG: response regulator [Betaproteobacteria bacterium]